jgi:hypothetical protein
MTPSHALAASAVKYVHWGVIQISLANLLIIIAMVVVFVLALLLPFPGSHADPAEKERVDDEQ